MTLSEKEQAVLAGVAEIDERDDDRDPHQVLISRLYQEVYEETGEEQPDLDGEVRVVLESLVQMGLVEHRPPTKPVPELTDTGRGVHEEGPEAVEFDHPKPDDDEQSKSGGNGLLGKIIGLFS